MVSTTPSTGEPNKASGDPDAEAEEVARTIALRLLTARARSREELRRAMRRKRVPEQVMERVLTRFEEVGLVDDSGFAQAWVESRQERRHLSKTALRHELRTRGVEPAEIDAAVGQVCAEDETEAARALAVKKLAATRGLPAEVRYRRLVGLLTRRGFGSATIAAVVNDALHGEDGDA